MRIRNKQHGYAIELAILATLLFFVCASIAIKFKQERNRGHHYEMQADGIRQIQIALQSYAAANKSNFQQSKTVMFVNDQYAPTMIELRSLGFLSNSGTNTNPFGTTYATTLQLQANGSVTGMVYLTGNILDRAGNPDRQHACEIARALGPTGLCTPPTNANILGNMTTQRTNPTGLPAVIGALVFVPT